MKRLLIVILMLMLIVPCTACDVQMAELRNRTEEEILASVTDEPYEELITVKTDHLAVKKLISSKKYLGGKDSAPMEGPGWTSIDLTLDYPKELTLTEVNQQFPIQCLRKSGEGRYYAIYLNEYGDPFYLCFYKHSVKGEKEEYLYHKALMIPTVTGVSFEVGKTTLDEYMEAVSFDNYNGNNVMIGTSMPLAGPCKIYCMPKGEGRVLRLFFGINDTETIDRTSGYSLLQMEDASFLYEIAKEDYPK